MDDGAGLSFFFLMKSSHAELTKMLYKRLLTIMLSEKRDVRCAFFVLHGNNLKKCLSHLGGENWLGDNWIMAWVSSKRVLFY